MGTDSSKVPIRSSADRRMAMFALHTKAVSVSRGPRSRVVTGAGSRPHDRGAGPSRLARIGPPSASAHSCSRAPSSIAASHPAGARTSSSTRTISGAPAAAMPVLRAALGPRAWGWRSSFAPARAATPAVSSCEPSSTTITSNGSPGALAQDRFQCHLQIPGPVLGRHDH